MLLKSSTYQQQSLLAEFTRTGNEEILKQLKGINHKGIKYYRHLIFNIIQDGITNAYPILTDFLGEHEMNNLIHRFFSNHRCQTYQVWQMPKEFKEYVIQQESNLIETYPFIPDLLLFEWMEIELFMMEDDEIPKYQPTGNILKDKLVLNPEIQILSMQYPVHIKHPKLIKNNDKGTYFVALHRHPETKEIIFTNIDFSSLRIIELLYDEEKNFDDLLNTIFEKPSLKNKDELKKFIRNALETKMILGFKH